MDHAFYRFHETLKKNRIKIQILSGSPAKGVEDYLNKMDCGEIMVHGNLMEVKNDRVFLHPLTKIEETLCKNGSCAHCKSLWIKKEHDAAKKVIYIGDGLTDTCAAGYADIVFAKKSLARYCTEKGIYFVPFNNFDDIHQHLFGY